MSDAKNHETHIEQYKLTFIPFAIKFKFGDVCFSSMCVSLCPYNIYVYMWNGGGGRGRCKIKPIFCWGTSLQFT